MWHGAIPLGTANCIPRLKINWELHIKKVIKRRSQNIITCSYYVTITKIHAGEKSLTFVTAPSNVNNKQSDRGAARFFIKNVFCPSIIVHIQVC